MFHIAPQNQEYAGNIYLFYHHKVPVLPTPIQTVVAQYLKILIDMLENDFDMEVVLLTVLSKEVNSHDAVNKQCRPGK